MIRIKPRDSRRDKIQTTVGGLNQSSATTVNIESSFRVTWKRPELQRTCHTDDPPLEGSFSMTFAQGWPLPRIAAASSPSGTSPATTPVNQPHATTLPAMICNHGFMMNLLRNLVCPSTLHLALRANSTPEVPAYWVTWSTRSIHLS